MVRQSGLPRMMFSIRPMVSIWSVFVFALFCVAHSQAPDLKESLEKYSPKSCKYNLLPRSAGSRAYKNFMGEVHLYDVFGMPSAVKRHVLRLDIEKESFITLQAEVHRDTPTSLTVDVYRRGAVGKPGGRVLSGRNSMGAGGDDTKAFLHGVLNEKQHGEVDIVFELISVEVAASQVDARVNEDRCWPIRLDLAVVPTSRAALHWPTSCPTESKLPASLGNEITILPDNGLSLALPKKSDDHYSFRFGDERPWEGFGRALWSGTIEVPVRLHRFARFFFRTSFRFPSSPLQLVLELFDLKDQPDGTALVPKCAMGCMGGVPVYNGQILDHAMPTGFRYRLWLLAANQEEWTASLPDRGRHCVEFDFDYSVRYEQRLTPFEVGPTAWLCEYTRLPQRIVQTAQPAIDAKANDNLQVVAGRTIWIRDRFGFPPEEVSDMEHKIDLIITEASIFRATTHHSDGVDVFLALTRKGETQRACNAVRHPGSVPRQTIFCRLDPGTYVLTFFADYPLGGLHPCSDFFAQIAVRPIALNDAEQTQQCLSSASDLSRLKIQRSMQLATAPNWKNMRVPIVFGEKPTTAQIWTQSIEILDGEEAQNLYLRLVVHSDYVSSDIRFQVKYEGKYIADTQVTSHGYADMIGPLDSGTYTVGMYYVTGVGPTELKLCSASMVDLRVVSQAQYVNRTAQWLCTSSRVPPPDALSPQPDEQILLDSEYVVPNSGVHTVRLQVTEPRLIRIKAYSADADFLVQLRTWPKLSVVATGENHFEAVVGKGTFSLRIKAIVRSVGNGAACSTMRLNLLLQPYSALPQCPWATSSSYDAPAANTDQVQASDHIGNVLLDLVPQHLTQDTKPKPPVTFWMSQGMEKSFEMVVDSTAAMRLDVVVQPPFLPLEVSVRRKRDSGKLEPPIAVAEWMESRLLLLQNDLPRGRYLVEFLMPRKYAVQEDANLGEGALSNLCAHVTITAEVGVTSKEAINSMRAELLDLPDLLAVQPFLPNLNAVGWFSSPLSPVLGTQVYHFPDKSGSATLKVDDRALVRVVCEPADLSNAEANVQLLKAGDSSLVVQGDSLGQLVAPVEAGDYILQLTPKEKAPFLVTVGVATFSRLKEDILLMDSSKPCASVAPKLEDGIIFSPRGWSIGPTLVRLQQSFLQKTGLIKVPIEIAAPSILYLEAGSALPLDLVRISLQVPEGLWVGEQRGMRNSLQIELPPGKYVVFVGQPKTVSEITRCLDFSVYISAVPINPDAAAEAEAATASKQGGSRKELTMGEQASVESAPCFSMGTVPLPLDLSDPDGGSKILGGPLSADGRLLIRQRVLLTDMHDGRKKLFIKTGRKKLMMKIGVTLGGYTRLSLAAQLSFTVQPIGMPGIVEPVESWSQSNGWERIFLLDSTSSGFWLAFHHAHRERGESACLHFGLELEIHPYDDMGRMFTCPGDGTARPEDIFPDSFSVEQTFTARTTFRYNKGMTWLRQVQQGFLTKTSFTISVRSFVSAEVAYNFFLSHAEMDIVLDRDSQNQVATADTELKHSSDHPLNVRQVIGRILEPGDYTLRIADDHYPSQLDGVDSACFPFSFEFRIVPEKASPAIVSVLPHPSVPIPKGTDLVLTVRFSEPPEGSVQDVVKAVSLGGVQAVTAASMNAMSTAYGQKTTQVQAETAEGHLLWVISFSAQAVAGMGDTAKLTLAPLRSNVSKRLFKFNPPTYTLVQVPKGIPWSAVSSSGSNSDATPANSQPVPESSNSVGESVPEGSKSSGQVAPESGQVAPEASASSNAPVPETPAQSSVGSTVAESPSTGSAMPEKTVVQEEKATVSFKAGDGGLGEVKFESSAAQSTPTSSGDSAKSSGNIVSETIPPPAPTVTPAPPPSPTETPAPPAPTIDATKAEDTSIGAPRAEGTGSVRAETKPTKPPVVDRPKSQSSSSSVGDVGVPKAESAGTVRSSSPTEESVGSVRSSSPKEENVGTVRSSNEWSNWRSKAQDQDDEGSGPTVHHWTPEDDRPAVSVASSSSSTVDDDQAECPEGTKLNVDTGICDSSGSESSSFWSGPMESIAASMPSGYGTVLAACTATLVGLAMLMNCLPQLKAILAKFTNRSSTQQAAPGMRFKDIGARRAEEERGLMSYDDDEDML